MLIGGHQSGQSGFSLVELMIGVVVLGILSALAFPSFQSMLRDRQVRNAAEAITNGLQRARGEAVARNRNIAFTLLTGTTWTVTIAATGELLERREGNEGSKDVVVEGIPSGASIATFNNVGSQVANLDGSASVARFNLSAEGSVRPLSVLIGLGGNARMCDPNVPSTNVSSCN
jgi:type IV fimbrial biogenesis protein FimT